VDPLLLDPRLSEAVELFDAGAWYACHDGLEALWHETNGPWRPALQGLLQIAVSRLHLERGNRRGATILLGEGLGRLRTLPDAVLGLDLGALKRVAAAQLELLQTTDAALPGPFPPLKPPLVTDG
jgi:predicted metal-dependent hydrolase